MTQSMHKDKFFIKQLATFWCPERVEFREQYNTLFIEALLHAKKHGDITLANRLITPIPDAISKQFVIKNCYRVLKLGWNEPKQSLQGALNDFTDNDITSFRAIDKAVPVAVDKDHIAIDKGVYSREEFVDMMLDTIILNRKAFTLNELEKVEETLEIVKRRICKIGNELTQ